MINLVDILDASANAHPDKVAMRFKDRSFTFSDVKDRVDRLAGALADRGTERRGHVAVITPNTSACIEIVFACARLGAVCEQYNTRLSALSIVGLLQRSDARIVFLSCAMYDVLKDHLESVGRPLTLILLDGVAGDEAAKARAVAIADGGDALDYENVLAEAEPLEAAADVSASDAVIMLYTSGTTGMPRGVLLSHEALLARIEIDTKEMWFTPDDVSLSVLPLFHVTCVTAFVTVANGAELVIADSHKPEDVAAMIRTYGVTRVGLVPFLLRALADYVERNDIGIDTLRLIVYGGEPISLDLLTRCQKLLKCDFLQGYGMTETASAITMLTPEHHKNPRLLSTVGTVVPGMELKVVDRTGKTCPPEIAGEVLVKTRTLMSGYYHDPERTDDVIRDGWYCTGDIGILDEEGFLTLVDRKNNLVITGGENVYPLEVGRCIEAMGDDIVDVVVIGIPDAVWGETLAAVVVRKEGSDVTEADIVAHCAHRLGGYKKPRKVLFVDSLVRNASGKVPKDYLEKIKEQLM